MNRETLWPIVRERAVMDRVEYMEAWSSTGNDEVLNKTQSEIDRIKSLKGVPFKDALAKDREGVRLAFLASECWYSGLSFAQVGREKRTAIAMFKRVHAVRCKLFGKTMLEAMASKAISVPIHKVSEMIQSGLSPSEFVATLNHQ